MSFQINELHACKGAMRTFWLFKTMFQNEMFCEFGVQFELLGTKRAIRKPSWYCFLYSLGGHALSVRECQRIVKNLIVCGDTVRVLVMVEQFWQVHLIPNESVLGFSSRI